MMSSLYKPAIPSPRLFAQLLTFLSLFWMGSCSVSTTVDPADAEYYVYAEADGESFRYEGMEDVRTSNAQGSGYFAMGAYPAEFEELSFFTLGALDGKPGTFDIRIGRYRKSRYEEYVGDYYYQHPAPIQGKCTITRIDDFVVEGTFYFDAYSDGGKGNRLIKVRNGRFRVRY